MGIVFQVTLFLFYVNAWTFYVLPKTISPEEKNFVKDFIKIPFAIHSAGIFAQSCWISLPLCAFFLSSYRCTYAIILEKAGTAGFQGRPA